MAAPSVIHSPSKHDRLQSRRLGFAGTMDTRRQSFRSLHAAIWWRWLSRRPGWRGGQVSNGVLMRLAAGFHDFRGNRLPKKGSPICPNYGINYTRRSFRRRQNNTFGNNKRATTEAPTTTAIIIIISSVKKKIRGV